MVARNMQCVTLLLISIQSLILCAVRPEFYIKPNSLSLRCSKQPYLTLDQNMQQPNSCSMLHADDITGLNMFDSGDYFLLKLRCSNLTMDMLVRSRALYCNSSTIVSYFYIKEDDAGDYHGSFSSLGGNRPVQCENSFMNNSTGVRGGVLHIEPQRCNGATESTPVAAVQAAIHDRAPVEQM